MMFLRVEGNNKRRKEMLVNHGPKLLNAPAKLMVPAKAESVAAELRECDEDWSYVVKHCPKGTGFSFVEIYDEDGEFVSYWK